MMKDDRHIEEIFRESFKNFEGDVAPQLWQNISSRLQSPVPSPQPGDGGAGTFGKIISGITGGGASTWIASVVAIVAVTASVFYFVSSEKQNVQAVNGKTENATALNKPVTEFESSTGTEQKTNLKSVISKKDAAKPEVKVEKSNQKSSSTSGEITPGNSSANEAAAPALSESSEPVTANSKDDSKHTDPQKNEPSTELNPKERIVELTAYPQSGKAPLEVSFNVFGSLSSFTINFGDSEKSNAYNSIHIFTEPGIYEAELTGYDGSGNPVRRNITIEVLPALTDAKATFIETIPNVFTPNGDGINDEFKIKGTDIKSFQCIIFNTKGKEIYRWNNSEGSWNGKLSNGMPADSGHYYFTVIAISKDGRNFKNEGSLQLIR